MTDQQERLARYIEQLPDDMERKLARGREKYGYSWTDSDPEYLLRRMEEEFYEFRQAVEHEQDEEHAVEEAADMVNFGLMYLARMQEES